MTKVIGRCKIKLSKSITDDYYDKNSYREALNSERIKELMECGSFYCEFFKDVYSRDLILAFDITRFCTIDLQNVCGKIIEVTDDDITVELTGSKGYLVKNMIEENPDNYRAYLRAIGSGIRNTKNISKIITFDICGIQ